MTDKLTWLFIGWCLVLILFLANFPIYAHDIITINNYPTEVVEVQTETMKITSGISDDDLATGIATAAASGGHQFDFATYDWQGSITGAWYEDADSVSFGAAKRFEKVNALFHVNYTQNGDDDLYVIGGTFRF